MSDLENKIFQIMNKDSFSGEKRVEVVKAVAEAKCRISPKRRRKLGDEVAKHKRQKCIKRKTSELWWTMLMQREPVTVRGVTVQIEGNEITVKKNG